MSPQPAESDWLKVVGHPCRLKVMDLFLAHGTATPVDIAEELALPLGTVSFHIRVLARHGVLRLTGRTQRRGASVHHYQLADRERTASILWGLRARLLVSDFERETARGDATVTLDAQGLHELRALTAAYLARIGELGLQARERRSSDNTGSSPATKVAVLLATDEGGEAVQAAWR